MTCWRLLHGASAAGGELGDDHGVREGVPQLDRLGVRLAVARQALVVQAVGLHPVDLARADIEDAVPHEHLEGAGAEVPRRLAGLPPGEAAVALQPVAVDPAVEELGAQDAGGFRALGQHEGVVPDVVARPPSAELGLAVRLGPGEEAAGLSVARGTDAVGVELGVDREAARRAEVGHVRSAILVLVGTGAGLSLLARRHRPRRCRDTGRGRSARTGSASRSCGGSAPTRTPCRPSRSAIPRRSAAAAGRTG